MTKSEEKQTSMLSGFERLRLNGSVMTLRDINKTTKGGNYDNKIKIKSLFKPLR